MKFTNRSGLPDALLRAIANDPYDKGDAEFSITELLSPARQSALKLAHKHEIEEDAEERLWSLYGQIAHTILERANVNGIAEKRYFADIDGTRISGQVDTLDLDGGVLSDWKFTTSWGFNVGTPPKPEWVAQLNMQRWLLRQNGLDAKSLQIVGLLRDHSKLEAKRAANYPQQPVVVLPIPMWEENETKAFIAKRVAAHRAARAELPECTPEETWQRPDVWAVIKKGNKRAEKNGLHETEESARAHADSNPALSVIRRPGESVRCENYCAVSAFCSQFLAKKPKEESEA